MTFPAFKAGDAFLRETGGGFDFHTPPPHLISIERFDLPTREQKGTLVPQSMSLLAVEAERLSDLLFLDAPGQQWCRYSSSCGYPHGEVIPAELLRLFHIR